MRTLGVLLLGGAAALALTLSCAAGDSADSAGGGSGGSGNQSSGGTGATGGSGGVGAYGGTGGTGNTGNTGGTGNSGGMAGTGGSTNTGGAAGSGGTGNTGGSDAGPTWPTCDSKPSSAATKTISQIWTDDPSTSTEVWISGAYVSAVSGNGCTANNSCQLFIQTDTSYSSLSAAAHNGVNVRVAASVAQYFTGIAVGDRVDVLGWALRSTFGGGNELIVQVNSQLPGCMKKVGSGTLTPLSVQLSDLTVTAYESTHGPMLVTLSTVSGKPGQPKEIFGLWTTGVGIGDAGPEGLVNLSPYFLPSNSFTGLTAGVTKDFTSVTGVFAVYVPFTEAGTPPKYVVVYPRSMSDLQ
jgi:hypothetical protein